MKHKFLIIIALLSLLLISGSGAMAQNDGPETPTITRASVGTSFTYQGFLSESGGPADGLYAFKFRLFDALTIGAQVGSTLTKTGVTVENGYFTVELDFGNVYDGTALWLDLQVKRNAAASYTTLTPRQPVTAAPYALYAEDVGYHTHMWQQWMSSDPVHWGLQIQNTATSGTKGGIYAETKSPTGKGVHGSSLATTGTGAGVAGGSLSPDGRGVYGSGGTGVFGETWWSEGTAVHAEDFSTSGSSYGLFAETHSSNGIAGYFMNSGVNGTAIYAESDGGTASRATLHVKNTEQTDGIAAYIQANSSYATAHFFNQRDGQVLYLQNGSTAADGTNGGDFITAVNETKADIQFRVASDGSVYSDGGYNCGKSINDSVLLFGGAPVMVFGLNESYIAPCLKDDSPADFAEMLPAAAEMEPGDVLAIGLDGELIQATEPYQTTVIGVYSTRPSFLGNAAFADEDGYAPLAMLGVVPVKASAENGAIQPGDLLVASATPGHAMKAGDNPPQGTVIGKALEGLEDGTGVITIVVTLQ